MAIKKLPHKKEKGWKWAFPMASLCLALKFVCCGRPWQLHSQRHYTRDWSWVIVRKGQFLLGLNLVILNRKKKKKSCFNSCTWMPMPLCSFPCGRPKYTLTSFLPPPPLKRAPSGAKPCAFTSPGTQSYFSEAQPGPGAAGLGAPTIFTHHRD